MKKRIHLQNFLSTITVSGFTHSTKQLFTHQCPVVMVVSSVFYNLSIFPHFSSNCVSCNHSSCVIFSITNISSTVLNPCSTVGGSALYHDLVIAFLLADNRTLTRYSSTLGIISCVKSITHDLGTPPYFIPISYYLLARPKNMHMGYIHVSI